MPSDPYVLEDHERPSRPSLSSSPSPPRGSSGSSTRAPVWGVVLASGLGAAFAGVSTHDFISHLDRQQHSIHCSLVPGTGAIIGESGCRTVLMSPYSSVLRTELWGGLPISLLALGVFAYLVYRAMVIVLTPRITRRDTGYLWLAACLPAAMSGIYGYISTQTLDALCQVCLGIYIASGLAFLCAALAHKNAESARAIDSALPQYMWWFTEGVIAVGVLVGLFFVFSPKSSKNLAGCGVLANSGASSRVRVPSRYRRGTKAVMVLDPLCPACRGFDRRLEASGLGARMDLDYILFPLDASCNWMVKTSVHPGACAVSEAMLCAPDDAETVLAWAFANQETLLASADRNDGPVRSLLKRQFPSIAGCLGSNAVKSKLRKSLRWGVANAIPVLTPQLFVADKRLCDEDTDLGLEYTLTAMLDRAEGRR